MFYLYTDGQRFISIGGISIHRTKKIEKASYWFNKKRALSWKTYIQKRYPEFELKEATLIIKK